MNNRILRKAALVITATAITATAIAQDIHFSQFYETSILRNPSLTGIFSGDYKVGIAYKNQWNAVSNKAYQTGMVSAETRFPINERINDFVSVGLLSYYDRAGSAGLQTLTAYPAINYNKSLEDENSSFLSVGFTGGYIQRNFDVTKITVDNQYLGNQFSASNPTGENIPSQQVTMWDLGAGVTFSSNSSGADNATTYYVGVAGYHFTKPRNSFFGNNDINLDVRWNATAGMSTKLSEDYTAQAHANYSKQGSHSEIIAGGLIGWNKPNVSAEGVMFSLNGGVFYRVGDAIIPVVELKYKDISIGASYDMNISKLKAASQLRGGFELTVFKTGLFKNPSFQKSRTICPHSFW